MLLMQSAVPSLKGQNQCVSRKLLKAKDLGFVLCIAACNTLHKFDIVFCVNIE